jgi:hypothetical protein
VELIVVAHLGKEVANYILASYILQHNSHIVYADPVLSQNTNLSNVKNNHSIG